MTRLAECHPQIRPLSPHSNKKKESCSVSFICLCHSSLYERQLVSRRFLLPGKLCSLALNGFCATERKSSNLRPLSTPNISSQAVLKTFLTKCVSVENAQAQSRVTDLSLQLSLLATESEIILVNQQSTDGQCWGKLLLSNIL